MGDYCVVSTQPWKSGYGYETYDQFTEKVKILIKEGWRCQGGISVQPVPSETAIKKEKFLFFQAMIKD